MKRFVLFILYLSIHYPLGAFETLSQAATYAKSMPEFPAIENTNVLAPSFAAFYGKYSLSRVSCFLENLGIIKPVWSPSKLCSLLAPLEKALTGSSRIVIEGREAEQLLVIGPLHGSFHGLVRILEEHKKQGYIDEDLRITKLHTFLVFNGALFVGSPYGLEILTLIAVIMRNNPKNVFYINDASNVAQANLHEELAKRGCAPVGCIDTITTFFKKSPSTLVVKQNDHTKDELIITASSDLSEYANREPRTGAFVVAEDRLIDYATHNGCILKPPLRGIPVWSIFSAASTLYRDYFHFYYDAYTIITLGPVLRESTITLYNRDIRTTKGFARAMEASLCTGISLNAKNFSFKKIDKKAMITLASSMDLSSAHKYIGLNIEVGITAALHRVNEEGGVNGRFLDSVIFDDQYATELSRLNIEEAIKDISRIIISPVGSATTAASFDLIKSKKIYVLFSNSGATMFRDPSLINMINFRASYKSEGRALVAYAYKTLRGRTFGFLIQNDEHGLSALEGAREMLKELGIKQWTEAYYEHNTVNIAGAVQQIKKTNPDVIGLLAVAPASIAFIRELGEPFFINKKLLAMSPLGEKSFRSFLRYYGLSAIFAQVVPDPKTSMLEIAQEYRRDIAAYGMDLDTYSFEGYIYGRLAADIFKKIEGPITPEAVARAVEKIKNYSFKGLMLTYDPADRQLANDLWLEVSPDKWIKQPL